MQILEISEEFVKKFGFYEYKEVTDVEKRISEFVQIGVFKDILQIVPLPKDERMMFKLIENDN